MKVKFKLPLIDAALWSCLLIASGYLAVTRPSQRFLAVLWCLLALAGIVRSLLSAFRAQNAAVARENWERSKRAIWSRPKRRRTLILLLVPGFGLLAAFGLVRQIDPFDSSASMALYAIAVLLIVAAAILAYAWEREDKEKQIDP